MDLDHHLDYYLAKKEIPFSYKKLVHFLKKERYPKVKLFLHSYEFIFLLWVSILVFRLDLIWVGIAVGFTIHLLCDEFVNPLKPLAYFLTYRIINRFAREHFFKKGYYD